LKLLLVILFLLFVAMFVVLYLLFVTMFVLLLSVTMSVVLLLVFILLIIIVFFCPTLIRATVEIIASLTINFLATTAFTRAAVVHTTRLHTTLGAFIPMVLTNGKAAKIARLVALALAFGAVRKVSSATHSTILHMKTHAGVALDRSTAGTCTLWGAKTFLIARLTTIHVTADSTTESRCSIKVDEVTALGTLPLLLNNGFLESCVCLGHIHDGLPISGLLGD
jgi:hypothetical protein